MPHGGRVGIRIARADGPMTAIIYFGEMLVVSVLAIFLLAISPLRVAAAAASFAGGVVAWTLAEYLVHRFVLHDLAPRKHGIHHANPDEPVLTIFWQIWVCFALLYLIAGGALLAGALVAYVRNRAAAGDEDMGPLVYESVGCRQTGSAAAASDDGDLSIQSCHRSSF